MFQTIASVLVAAVCLTRAEYTARTAETFGGYMVEVWYFLLLGQFCLYILFNTAPSVMVAWLSFTLTMSAMRVANSYFILDEGLDMRFVCASAALMLAAALTLKQA